MKRPYEVVAGDEEIVVRIDSSLVERDSLEKFLESLELGSDRRGKVESPFTRTLYARWGDMDFNGHMANTAYLDACVDIRMMFFGEQGFSPGEFERLQVGPVVRRDEVDYYREFRLMEPITITLVLLGASEDLSHFRLRNEFFRSDGQKAARVVTTGGWLDLRTRRLVAPPDELRRALETMPRADDFQVLESSLRA